MVNSKNSLNLKPKKNTNNTFKKSISSRPQVDSLTKKSSNSPVIVNEIIKTKPELKIKDEKSQSSTDDNKRLFLKVASVAGLGLAASALFPKGAEAYVAGSTPTSNVVGIKNIANTKINPATEDTLSTRATEATLGLMKAQTDKLTFDGSNNLLTASSGGASVVGIKDASDVRINPAQDDSIILLRRMVKMVESLAVVDVSMRQRVVVEAAPSTAVTGTITANIGTGTMAALTTVNQLAGVDSRWQIIDWSRQVYNSGMRSNLSW